MHCVFTTQDQVSVPYICTLILQKENLRTEPWGMGWVAYIFINQKIHRKERVRNKTMAILSPQGHFQNSCVLILPQVRFPGRPTKVVSLILFSFSLSFHWGMRTVGIWMSEHTKERQGQYREWRDSRGNLNSYEDEKFFYFRRNNLFSSKGNFSPLSPNLFISSFMPLPGVTAFHLTTPGSLLQSTFFWSNSESLLPPKCPYTGNSLCHLHPEI